MILLTYFTLIKKHYTHKSINCEKNIFVINAYRKIHRFLFTTFGSLLNSHLLYFKTRSKYYVEL